MWCRLSTIMTHYNKNNNHHIRRSNLHKEKGRSGWRFESWNKADCLVLLVDSCKEIQRKCLEHLLSKSNVHACLLTNYGKKIHISSMTYCLQWASRGKQRQAAWKCHFFGRVPFGQNNGGPGENPAVSGSSSSLHLPQCCSSHLRLFCKAVAAAFVA